MTTHLTEMEITYQKFTLVIEALEELYLPYYKGSTFRGGFGNAFRRVVCALKMQDCKDCLLKQRCIYAYVFETPPDEGTGILNMHKYEKVPHPFVIEPPDGTVDMALRKKDYPGYVKQGETISFNLILIGRATDYLPYFIYTFDELGKIGIGKGRGRFRLREVRKWTKEGNSLVVYDDSSKIIRKTENEIIEIPEDFLPTEKIESLPLHLITPMRLKYNRDLVVTLEFHILIRNLLRRLGLLYYFHCSNQPPAWDHKEIIRLAEGVKIQSSDLRWFDWERYSTRQNTRMKLGGLIGKITFHGNIEPFLPYLRAGEILHAGKNTSFGLGRYEII